MSAEQALRAKAMLALDLEQKEIARLTGMTGQSVSSIKVGRTHKDLDVSTVCAFQCRCGKVLVDPLDECIYVVRTDEYFCSQECVSNGKETENDVDA